MPLGDDVMRELDARGLVKDCSDRSGLAKALDEGGDVAVYAGFDPTADSLHVGHSVTLNLLGILADFGLRVIPVIGTATALIGDPTGRASARPSLATETVMDNGAGVSESVLRVLGSGVCPVANGDWYGQTGLLGFLRDVGAHIPMSRLLGMEFVKSRLGDTGISFLECAYPLLQAYDFLHLARSARAIIQIGGSDQWGNITMGLELIARTGTKSKAFGLTHPLLLKSDGTKMGKTSGGAIWLNPSRLGDFGFYQFWRTLPDSDVATVARLASRLPVSSIPDVATSDAAVIEAFKETLAYEMTARVRGGEAAWSARAASRGRGRDVQGLVAIDVSVDDLADIPGLAVAVGLSSSKAAVRRIARQRGIYVNGVVWEDGSAIDKELVAGGEFVLSLGKNDHRRIRFAPRTACPGFR